MMKEHGIYQQPNGSYRVVARIGDRKTGPPPKEKRFPKGSSLRDMRRWRDDTRADMRRQALRPVRGTLAADAVRYLAIMQSRLKHPGCRVNETRAWFPRFGMRMRHTLTTEEVRQQMLDWEIVGVAASTIKHRLSALSQLFETLDGKSAHNPTRGLARPKEPAPQPGGRSVQTIGAVLDAFEARVVRSGRGWKTLARLKVLAHTGMRHSQMMRMRPDDIRLEDRTPNLVVVDPGKDGAPHIKPLTEAGRRAVELFIAHDAFGAFSRSSLYKSWKLACEEAGVQFFNPYKLRHSYATMLRAEGLDLADVQQLLGHKSAKTTERYAAVSPDMLSHASDLLEQAWTKTRSVPYPVRKESTG